MKTKLHVGSRIIFGLMFLVFGLNGFLQFMPVPPMTPEAGALLGAFAKTGYFFPMIKILELVLGFLILINVMVPFSLVAMTPILVGITTIHLFLNPAGLPMMIVFHVLHAFLVAGYFKELKPLLTLKTQAFRA
jgi:hypothetical protein